MPIPGFIGGAPLKTQGGARFRPDGSDDGIMTHFAPPGLPLPDVPQSPGEVDCTLTITVPDFGKSVMFFGGSSYCCFSGVGGALYKKTITPTKEIEIKVPCYIAAQFGPSNPQISASSSNDFISAWAALPPLPGVLNAAGGCSLTY